MYVKAICIWDDIQDDIWDDIWDDVWDNILNNLEHIWNDFLDNCLENYVIWVFFGQLFNTGSFGIMFILMPTNKVMHFQPKYYFHH